MTHEDHGPALSLRRDFNELPACFRKRGRKGRGSGRRGIGQGARHRLRHVVAARPTGRNRSTEPGAARPPQGPERPVTLRPAGLSHLAGRSVLSIHSHSRSRRELRPQFPQFPSSRLAFGHRPLYSFPLSSGLLLARHRNRHRHRGRASVSGIGIGSRDRGSGSIPSPADSDTDTDTDTDSRLPMPMPMPMPDPDADSDPDGPGSGASLLRNRMEESSPFPLASIGG
jgi:hypothetical protein